MNHFCHYCYYLVMIPATQFRSSRPEVFLGKDVLKICCRFTREHPCRSVILIKLLCNIIEITLRHALNGCFWKFSITQLTFLNDTIKRTVIWQHKLTRSLITQMVKRLLIVFRSIAWQVFNYVGFAKYT